MKRGYYKCEECGECYLEIEDMNMDGQPYDGGPLLCPNCFGDCQWVKPKVSMWGRVKMGLTRVRKRIKRGDYVVIGYRAERDPESQFEALCAYAVVNGHVARFSPGLCVRKALRAGRALRGKVKCLRFKRKPVVPNYRVPF